MWPKVLKDMLLAEEGFHAAEQSHDSGMGRTPLCRTAGRNTKGMCVDHPRRALMGDDHSIPRQRFQKAPHAVIDVAQAVAAGADKIPIVVFRGWHRMAHDFLPRHP